MVCLAYATQAVAYWLLPAGAQRQTGTALQRHRSQWLSTIGLDLLAFSSLHLLEPTSNLNFAALLVLPVLMAGAMSKRLSALATASVGALVLLGGVGHAYNYGADGAVLLTQAGLAGIGLFVIALLSGEMAQRLAREERAAKGSMEFARQQARLNRLVIEEMTEGVLMLDRQMRVRAANPSAKLLLGSTGRTMSPPFQLHADPGWASLLAAAEEAYALGAWPDSARELSLGRVGEESVRVQVRARFTLRQDSANESGPPEDICVLFVEDARAVQTRVRQEKLAAMGRMSAGVAHEIRNPLAAITQANDLMREDSMSPQQARLAHIVADNAARLKRIVDDVMEVAPGAMPPAQPVNLVLEVRRVCDDWSQLTGLGSGPGSCLSLVLPEAQGEALFDPDHLRRVLTNLLDNALRHASGEAACIEVSLSSVQVDRFDLCIASDGAVIPPEVDRYLFEPFFSTRSRGTGLGLYICRELCERNGARLEYLRQEVTRRHRNLFRVRLRRVVAGS